MKTQLFNIFQIVFMCNVLFNLYFLCPQDLNLDLVQFPRTVLVNEIRVIPLGTKVQADVPGGVRLG
jgi:hypothetical protein